MLGGSTAQNLHCIGVNGPADVLVFFGLIHGGVGRTVDDNVDVVACNEIIHGSFVADVEGVHIGEKQIMLVGLRQDIAELSAQLAVAACYEYVFAIVHIFVKRLNVNILLRSRTEVFPRLSDTGPRACPGIVIFARQQVAYRVKFPDL